MTNYLELLDWRRRVAELYAELRRRDPSDQTLQWFRGEKDLLFARHPQTPLSRTGRKRFKGLPYWPHDTQVRVMAQFSPADTAADVPTSGQDRDQMHFTVVGHLDFTLYDRPCRLGAYWIHGYAGGLFVPFTDDSSGTETYGGGRYLLDTSKGADLGSSAEQNVLLLDFNYAYHPSCAYDFRWVCPLAPPENRLPFPVYAGERLLGH